MVLVNAHFRTIGQEPDPAKRLRQRWGKEMRFTRVNLLDKTLDELAKEMTEAGYQVTGAAISNWERGENYPRYHLQLGWCKVTGRRHSEVFVMTDEAA